MNKREAAIIRLLAGWGAGCERVGLTELLPAGESRTVVEVRARLLRRWAETDARAGRRMGADLADGSRARRTAGPRRRRVGQPGTLRGRRVGAGSARRRRRAAAVEAVAGEAVRTVALVALALITAQLASPSRDALLRRATMELAVQDPDALAKWAGETPPGPSRAELLSGVALVWSEQNPVKAAIIAQGDLPEGQARFAVIENFAIN